MQTAEPVRQDPEKKETLNKLADRLVAEKRPASGGDVVEKEKSVIFNASNVRGAIMGIPYLIMDAVTAKMMAGPDKANRMAIVKWRL